uniref:Uncharacterized protein n=1 Tax=Steinernema glaseri TaxID=37863 RepID=A0A1I7ZDS9_9BILA
MSNLETSCCNTALLEDWPNRSSGVWPASAEIAIIPFTSISAPNRDASTVVSPADWRSRSSPLQTTQVFQMCIPITKKCNYFSNAFCKFQCDCLMPVE